MPCPGGPPPAALARQRAAGYSLARLAEDCFYPHGIGGLQALVDGEGLPEVFLTFGRLSLLEQGSPDAFQGACLLEGCVYVARDA